MAGHSVGGAFPPTGVSRGWSWWQWRSGGVAYTDQPTEMQLLAYVAVLLVTFILIRLTASLQSSRVITIG